MNRRTTTFATVGLLVACLMLAAGGATAQELEPRFFSQVPVGMNFAAVSVKHLEGGMQFDQATTIEDATGELWGVGAGYLRTLSVFGFSSKLSAGVPVMWGDWKGIYQGEPATASRRGLGDPSAELSVNFLGAPAMSLKEMRGFRQRWVAGASVKVTAPVGQYDPSKLLNLGTNRWATRLRLGVSRKINRLSLEAMGSMWLFQKNDDFLGGNTLEQEPLYSAQFNAIYEFPSRIWFGVGAGFSRGGQARTNGVTSDTYRKNTRWAAIFSYPLGLRHSVKVIYVSELSTRVGADFDQFTLGWSMRWGGEN